MLNDAMYGILFRDINPAARFGPIFQPYVNAYAGIEIQAGEDNYLPPRTPSYTVTASRLSTAVAP